MTTPRPFAVFDIDGTLIRWQLFHAIVHSLGKQGYILRGTHDKIHAARMNWKNRETNEGFRAYEKVLVDAYLQVLTSIDPADYLRVVDEVFHEYKDQTFTYTRDLVRTLKEKGYLLFAISGSQNEVIQRLAQHHGFDAAIGAEFVQLDSAFTGEVITPIHDKRAALERLVKQFDASYEGSYAVGDSPSDAAMLEVVENPIAFNPARGLFDIAQKHHWPIVVERKNVIYELQSQNESYILSQPAQSKEKSTIIRTKR